MYVILSVACLFVKTNEFITCTIYVHTGCLKSMDTLNDSLGYLDIRISSLSRLLESLGGAGGHRTVTLDLILKII